MTDQQELQAIAGMMPEKELHTHDSIPCFICDEDCSVCIRNKALTDSAKALSEQVASVDEVARTIFHNREINGRRYPNTLVMQDQDAKEWGISEGQAKVLQKDFIILRRKP